MKFSCALLCVEFFLDCRKGHECVGFSCVLGILDVLLASGKVEDGMCKWMG